MIIFNKIPFYIVIKKLIFLIFWRANSLLKKICTGWRLKYFGYEWVCFLLFCTSINRKNLLSTNFYILVVLFKPSTKVSNQLSLLFKLVKPFIAKRNPNRVLFKLFSNSLNVKIFSSELVFFTLVKVLEESSFRR